MYREQLRRRNDFERFENTRAIGRDHIVAPTQQLASMLGNQAMLGLMRSGWHTGGGDPSLIDEMEAKFGLSGRSAEQAVEAAPQGSSLPDYMREKFGTEPRSRTSGSTGGQPLPDALRKKYEEKSGLPMDDVRVHYNSDEPDKFGALAYTYGSEVHVGPGQEKHLGHELVHVVQQKQGIVRPTGFTGGRPVNTEKSMELRADSADVAWSSVPVFNSSGVPVMQMMFPPLRTQKGNNCGFHALARALLAMGAFGEVDEEKIDTNSEHANVLTRFAAGKNLTATGEAFDPQVLVDAYNIYRGEHQDKDKSILKDQDISVASVSFKDSQHLSALLQNAKTHGAEVLFPYNVGEDGLPVGENKAVGAHWAVIDPGSGRTTRGTTSYNLYEGNMFGIKKDEFEECTPPQEPALVTIEDLFESNKSISDEFNWKKFYEVATAQQQDALRKITQDYYEFRDRDKEDVSLDFGEFSKRLHEIKNKKAKADPKDNIYNDGKEKVNLKGQAIVIAKNEKDLEEITKLVPPAATDSKPS